MAIDWKIELKKAITNLKPSNMTEKEFRDEVDELISSLRLNIVGENISAEYIYEEIRKLSEEN